MGSGFSLFPEQASTLAPRVDNLYFFIVAVTAFFAVLVSVLVIVFAAKYHTKDPLAVGQPIHGSLPLELAWSIIPFLISIVIFAWAADVFFDLQRPPDQTLEIYATAKRSRPTRFRVATARSGSRRRRSASSTSSAPNTAERTTRA
jgi:cytochrome c oxidase subunit 2